MLYTFDKREYIRRKDITRERERERERERRPWDLHGTGSYVQVEARSEKGPRLE